MENLEDIENIEYKKTNWEDWPSKKTKVTAQLLMKIENIIEKLCKVVSKHITDIKSQGELLKNDDEALKQVRSLLKDYYSGGEFIPEISYKSLDPIQSEVKKVTLTNASGKYNISGNICFFNASGTVGSDSYSGRYIQERVYLNLPHSGKIGDNVGVAVWHYNGHWYTSAGLDESADNLNSQASPVEIYCSSTSNKIVMKSGNKNIRAFSSGDSFSVSGWYFIK